MAPAAPLGRKGLLRRIKDGPLPVGFGSPHPHHAVVEQDGVFRVRALQVDEAEAQASHDAAAKAGDSWMPEHYYALGKPTGPVALEAPTLKELVRKLEALEPWPQDW